MSEVRRGQTWACDETNAEGDVPEPHDVALWEDRPRFRAVVDDIVGGLVQLTVTTGNTHPRTPEAGEKVDVPAERLNDRPRWSLYREAPTEREVADA